MKFIKTHCSIAAFAVAVAIAGCTAYPDKVRPVKTQLSFGVDDAVPIEYRAEPVEGKNELLAHEERGRIAQLQGRYKESAESYRKAMNLCARKQNGPLVSVGDTLRSSLAYTYGNDLGLQYPITTFDQMMLYTLDAFNRLALSEWDNFGVDVRNLVAWRNEANEIIMRDIEMLNEKLGKKRNEFLSSTEYTSLMNKEASFASGLKRSTDNIYSLFLIALYHEIIGDMSNALSAYGDIERIRSGIPCVTEGIARCEGRKMLAPDEGEVIVFLEEGFIPSKRNYRFQYGGLFTTVVLDLPYYSDFDCQPYEDGGPLVVSVDGAGVAMAEPFCDLSPLAVKTHEERLRGILARQISRTSIKAITRGVFSGMALAGAYCAAHGIGDDRGYTQTALLCVGIVGSIGMSIMAPATEQADLRSWLLLPRQVQIARFPMKAGTHKLTLSSAEMTEDVVAEVKPGQKTIVHCTAVPNVMKAFAVCADKIK